MPLLRSREDCLRLADAVLSEVAHGDAEVTVSEVDSALTRYAGNVIHQNVAETGLWLRLRVVHEGRVGVAEFRGGEAGAAARLAAGAEAARRVAPAQKSTAPLPRPDGEAGGVAGWSDATAEATPELRADAVATIVSAAAGAGMEAFGALSTTARQTAIVNTVGVRRHARDTAASHTSVVRGGDGAAYADRHGVDVDGIDTEELAAEVVERAQRNQGASALEPGVYPVVLSPYAVAEMIEYLAYMGFGALAKQEGRSFMRPGEQMMSESVTIRDDAADPAGFPFPFDAEGVTTRTVTAIDAGACGGFVYDTPTALVDGVTSTGHGLPQPNTVGPMANHLVLEPGAATVDELVAGVRRGLLVTRFWYLSEVHPLRTVITGMTREGTFLIEDGRAGRPVRDLRFTQSIVDALATVEGVSAQRRAQLSDYGTSVLAPWMSLGRFTFTS